MIGLQAKPRSSYFVLETFTRRKIDCTSCSCYWYYCYKRKDDLNEAQLLKEKWKRNERSWVTQVFLRGWGSLHRANHKMIFEEERAKVDKGQHHRIVGKLIYLTHTRPNLTYVFFKKVDLTYVVKVVSQFMHDPRMRYMKL